MKSIEMCDLRENAAEIIKKVLWLKEPVKVCTPLGNAVILPEEVYEQLLAAVGKMKEEYCRKELCNGRREEDENGYAGD